MRGNTNQKIFEYGHFSRSGCFKFLTPLVVYTLMFGYSAVIWFNFHHAYILSETGVQLTFKFGLTSIPVPVTDLSLWQSSIDVVFLMISCIPRPCVCVSWVTIAVSWWWKELSAIFICFALFRSPWQLKVGNFLYTFLHIIFLLCMVSVVNGKI